MSVLSLHNFTCFFTSLFMLITYLFDVRKYKPSSDVTSNIISLRFNNTDVGE